jgi:cytochrome c-type biogenesis protein CcmH/NrfG
MLEKGQSQAGINYLQRAVELEAYSPELYSSLGEAYLLLDMPEAAMQAFAKSVELKPDNLNLLNRYARLLAESNNVREAVKYYRRILTIQPNTASAAGELAWLLATSEDPQVRNSAEAVILAERAAARSEGRPEAMITLAAAYASDSRFEEAVKVAEKILAAAKNHGNASLAETIERHLDLYRRGLPFSQPDQ